MTHLEAVGRLLAGVAPWVELGGDATAEGRAREALADLARRAIDRGVDPASPDFFNFNRGGQPLVDAAFLAQGLLRARRALIERFGVPANAIVVEPYARHTTTNLRNATRRLIAMKAPLDRDALIVSNIAHSQSIGSPGFVERNRRELGYQPGEVRGRVSPNDLAFRPSRDSLRVDPADPLDP